MCFDFTCLRELVITMQPDLCTRLLSFKKLEKFIIHLPEEDFSEEDIDNEMDFNACEYELLKHW